MKSIAAIAVLMITASVAWGQSASCTTLYTDSNITLCHSGDAYTQTFNNGSSISESSITAETYQKWMTEDTAALEAHNTQLKAVAAQAAKDSAAREAHNAQEWKALSITKKKACLSAGYVWTKGVCSLKDGQ